MKTAAASKHDIWSRQGQADQATSPPAGSATSASDQLQGRGKCGKPGTDVFRASEGLSSHTALNCIEDLLGPSAQLPTGARNGEDRSRLSAQLLQAEPLLMTGKAFTFAFPRVLCPGLPSETPRCSPSTQASPHPGWQLGTTSGSGQEQPSCSLWGPGGTALPCQLFRHQLCPSPGRGRRQDPALLLPGLLAERQELITLRVRPAPHLIAPLARRKINSTFYTLAASVLKFWHICEVKKKKKK